MTSARPALKRIGDRVDVPQPAFERFLRRRDRRDRTRRLMAGALGMAISAAVLLGIGAVVIDRGYQPADPSDLPANGAVVYGANESAVGGRVLYLAREGTVRPIVGEAGDGLYRLCPAFSRDGAWLAYVELDRRRDATPSVVITAMTPDALPIGVERRIPLSPTEWIPTEATSNICPAAWSPVGTVDAFSGQDGLRVVDPEERVLSVPLEVPGAGDSRVVAWAPDGSALLISERPGTPSIPKATLSPDGSKAAYVHDDRIVVVDADGTDPVTLPPTVLPDVSSKPLGISQVQWSPDGEQLLAIGYSPPGGYVIVAIPVDGRLDPDLIAPPTWGLYHSSKADLAWQPVPR